ncbi:alanine dehydrogenase [Usitatibacter palustris]|uniref:alanine dehydrogenase n=1 Tax=Usitatibacter palustris TaxID=2732487 RepID=A0A6M4H7S9_9PROT|nr:alanine dehydrogenase [Usitatibacter palustris]QJR15620.1 Alanine dehydrogenase [Usitatibacter palustris]
MRIGVPRETKDGERRVGLAPAQIRALVDAGHEVHVESGAGFGIGVTNGDYAQAGATVGDAASAWASELVVKVKELQPGEAEGVGADSTVFSYHHLAGEPARTREMASRGLTAIAYERVRDEQGGYPLLAPMSVMAGKIAVQVGAHLMSQQQGGAGTLLSGATGSEPARVLVLGAGHAGSNAARLAAAMGANVTVLCRSERTRDALRNTLGATATIDIATPESIEAAALSADLVVGAVFIPATPTPKLLPRTLVARMKRGAVIVDISIDAGGVAETSRPTSHAEPTFVKEGVVHYCVANMPAAFAKSGTHALASAVLPYVLELAGKGIENAVRDNSALRAGVVIWKGVPA